jgi:hypothetical protein
MSDAVDQDEWTGRSWAVGSAVVFTVAALIPGIGALFGACGMCAALYVLIVRGYTSRQKWISATCLLLSVVLAAFWLFILSFSVI